jgi:hypothetical protein
MKSTFFMLAAGCLATLPLSLPAVAAKAADISALERRLGALEAENQRLNDVLAIQKVQSLYQQYMNIGDGKSIAALFADSPDDEIELSNKGILKGRDVAARYFQGGPRPPGSLIFHTSVNPVIEISKDGLHAKAVWLSPGITTLPDKSGQISPNWNYGKYDMEYLKQNREWKILAFRWHQIFLTPYDQGWVKENLDPGSSTAHPADLPSKPGYYDPYSTTRTNKYEPPPPSPYKD